jgi:hypothetical protein
MWLSLAVRRATKAQYITDVVVFTFACLMSKKLASLPPIGTPGLGDMYYEKYPGQTSVVEETSLDLAVRCATKSSNSMRGDVVVARYSPAVTFWRVSEYQIQKCPEGKRGNGANETSAKWRAWCDNNVLRWHLVI